MTKETGGPAFPQPTNSTLSWDGMTLRDYFAAHAPECPDTWLSRYPMERGWRGEARAIADWRFEYADEMLKAREQ